MKKIIIRGQLNKRQTKKTTKQDSKQRRIKIRKYHLKKKQTNPDKPYKPCLISKNHNLWNLGPALYQEAQLPTNLILSDEIGEKFLLKKACKKKKKGIRF